MLALIQDFYQGVNLQNDCWNYFESRDHLRDSAKHMLGGAGPCGALDLFLPCWMNSPGHHVSPWILGPTDLSMKSKGGSSNASKNQLNATEVSTIKQLIAGYRESAAFLYRSADELEQLLLQQN